MKRQHLLSYVRRAVQDYHMIQPMDRIAVGISAGKDSLALLWALSQLKRFYPIPFELEAVTIHMGFDAFDLSVIHTFCESLAVPYTIYETQIAEIVFNKRQEKNPCSLCSKMRKGALQQVAKDLKCNKIALGHNQDDINETLLMSLFYEGRLHTMSPVNIMEDLGLNIIRPLIYVPEKDIRYFVKKESFPVLKSPCPADGNTKREKIKQLIYSLNQEMPDLPAKLFGAIERSGIDTWNIK